LAPALAEVHGQAEGRVRAGEDGRGEPGPAVWVGDRVELDDLALGDGEGDHGVGPPVHPQDGTGRTVDQGRVHLGGGAGALDRLAGDGGCSTGHGGPARAARAEVGTDHHLGVEHGHQGVEVARAAGGEEGVHHGSLPGQITLWRGGLGRLDAAAGSAGQLSGRLGGAPNQRRDLLEGQVEQIVEDEGEALGRGRGVDHDLQGEADPSASSSCCSGSGPPPGSGSDQGRSPPGTPRAGRCASAAG
jgi:hypothetical protein